MKTPNAYRLFALFALAALLLLACVTTDDQNHVLNMTIDKDNDSLLTYDSLVVKVTSKDSSFTQVVFHGKVTDPKQVLNMPLDSRVGQGYTISVVGYKGGKIGVNKLITMLGPDRFTSKDLPVLTNKSDTVKSDITKPDTVKTDTVIPIPPAPVILAPTDSSVAEGDSLRFRVMVQNPWTGSTTLTLKDAPAGAVLDTIGRNPGDGYFSWKPDFAQGRKDAYAVTFVYASAVSRVEKITRIVVMNVNRPPKLLAIPDQRVKESATLTLKVEASDPDGDSLTLSASGLPSGATFTAGTFAWIPTVGQAGNYSVKFKAFDGKDSDLTSALITVGNVDVPPPVTVKITFPGRDTTVNFTPVAVLYTVNGTPLQKPYPLKDGRNRVLIDTTIQGRHAQDTVIITLDTVPPGKPVLFGASPVNTRTPTWAWTSGGGGVGAYRYRLDSEDMVSALLTSDTMYIAPKDLDPGTHTLYVQERDAVGNWSKSGSRTVRIDTTKPPAPTVAVQQSSPMNNPRPSWTWTVTGDDIAGVYRYKLDNTDFRTGATQTQTTNFTPAAGSALEDGLHVLYVEQQDSAGNWSIPGSATVRIDMVPPNAPEVFTSEFHTLNSKPLWQWRSGGNGGCGIFRFKIGDANLQSNSVMGTDTSYQPSVGFTVGTRHNLYVQERDSAGNWSEISSLKIQVHGQTGYAVGTLGAMVKTSNGGTTWDTLTRVTNRNLNGVFFTDPNSGIAVGAQGTIIKTVNGGWTWSTIQSGTSLNLNSITFVDENRGVIVGDSGLILRTVDNGLTWALVQSPSNTSLTSIQFENDKKGVVVGTYPGQNRGILLTTNDTGLTWKLSAQEFPSALTSIGFSDASRAFIVGSLGAVFQSSDSGQTWTPKISATTNNLFSIQFASNFVGYAVGDGSTILKTTDAGDTWNALASGVSSTGQTRSFYSVSFTNMNVGFMVGRDAILMNSVDGAASWDAKGITYSSQNPDGSYVILRVNFRGSYFP